MWIDFSGELINTDKVESFEIRRVKDSWRVIGYKGRSGWFEIYPTEEEASKRLRQLANKLGLI